MWELGIWMVMRRVNMTIRGGEMRPRQTNREGYEISETGDWPYGWGC